MIALEDFLGVPQKIPQKKELIKPASRLIIELEGFHAPEQPTGSAP